MALFPTRRNKATKAQVNPIEPSVSAPVRRGKAAKRQGKAPKQPTDASKRRGKAAEPRNPAPARRDDTPKRRGKAARSQANSITLAAPTRQDDTPKRRGKAARSQANNAALPVSAPAREIKAPGWWSRMLTRRSKPATPAVPVAEPQTPAPALQTPAPEPQVAQVVAPALVASAVAVPVTVPASPVSTPAAEVPAPARKAKTPSRWATAAKLLLPARRKSASLLWWMLPAVIVGGWFYPYLGFLMLICMMAPIVIGFFRGRFWCGWVCPRGSFLDYVMGHFSRNKPAPAWLRSKHFRRGMLIFLMGMMGFQLTMAWPNPQAIGRVFIMLLTVTTVVGIGLAIAYRPRTWCTFCPMGTLASWVSRGKRPLTVNTSTCRSCSACSKVCPMYLNPHQPDNSHAICIKCEQCVSRCPRKSLSFDPKPELIIEQNIAA